MPFYDRRCVVCLNELIDCWEPMTVPAVDCPRCGQKTERVMLPTRRAAIGDDIPGGVLIFNGLCNEDGSPRRYYSKTEIFREAEKRGLRMREHFVELPGTDKNPNHGRKWH